MYLYTAVLAGGGFYMQLTTARKMTNDGIHKVR
jgi:hypothetical protein